MSTTIIMEPDVQQKLAILGSLAFNARIGWRSGRTTSRNSTTRVASVSFQASCW